jgi:hypothetical protein
VGYVSVSHICHLLNSADGGGARVLAFSWGVVTVDSGLKGAERAHLAEGFLRLSGDSLVGVSSVHSRVVSSWFSSVVKLLSTLELRLRSRMFPGSGSSSAGSDTGVTAGGEAAHVAAGADCLAILAP